MQYISLFMTAFCTFGHRLMCVVLAPLNRPLCARRSIPSPGVLVPEGKDTITQEEFAKYKWIIAPLNAMDRNLEVLADKDNSTTVITDDDGTLISMVAKGLGVTAVPELFIKELPDEVVMLKLDPQPTRELGIYLPPSPSPSAEAFRDYLIQRFPDAKI